MPPSNLGDLVTAAERGVTTGVKNVLELGLKTELAPAIIAKGVATAMVEDALLALAPELAVPLVLVAFAMAGYEVYKRNR